MTNKALEAYMDEYIQSLPDYDKDEAYLSSRAFAFCELYNFCEWLYAVKGIRLQVNYHDEPH